MSEQVKIVVNLESAGVPDEAFARRLFDEAMELQARGEEDQALLVLRAAREALSASELPAQEVVPLSAEELAQRDTDRAGVDAQLQATRTRARMGLRAKRDRLLAQTDVFALPDSALPDDLPAAVRDAIVNSRPAWRAFRQQLRDYMSTVDDPLAPPPMPEQPAAPAVVLT